MSRNKFHNGSILLSILFTAVVLVLIIVIASNKKDPVNNISSVPVPTTPSDQDNEHPWKNKKCGHESFWSKSMQSEQTCTYIGEYGAKEFVFEFPADWTFDIVGANIDNVRLINGETTIFIGIVAGSDKGSSNLDDAYWQETPESIKSYAIPRDKNELTREVVILGGKNVTKLNYPDDTFYVLFDSQDEYKDVFRIEVNSTDKEILDGVEKIITTLQFRNV